MNETMGMLRQLFKTDNEWAFPVDGTSRSGIEAVLVGLIEPGDKVLVPIYGTIRAFADGNRETLRRGGCDAGEGMGQRILQRRKSLAR